MSTLRSRFAAVLLLCACGDGAAVDEVGITKSPRWVAFLDAGDQLSVLRFDDVKHPIELPMLARGEALSIWLDQAPAWSSDGRSLAFFAQSEEGSQRPMLFASADDDFTRHVV